MRPVKALNEMLDFRGKHVKKGEILEVTDDEADRLVSRGVAVFADGMNARGRRVVPEVDAIDDTDTRPQVLRQSRPAPEVQS